MQQIENPSRQRILTRIRAALNASAPHRDAGASKQIFAPVSDLLERFQKECAANHTECVVTPDLRASAAAISDLLAPLPPGEVFLQDVPVLRRFASAWHGGRDFRWSSEGGPREESQATITLAESVVAATGSILVSAECGGRGASVAAPVHIVLADLAQLVPDLEAALRRARESGASLRNSMLCLITGSSRTADIEKIVVMGAHGPRRLVVVLALRSD